MILILYKIYSVCIDLEITFESVYFITSKIINAVRKLEQHSNNGKDKYEAWNHTGIELVQAAKVILSLVN